MTSSGIPGLIRRRSTALGLAAALMLTMVAGGSSVSAQQSQPGCPPDGTGRCTINVDLGEGVIQANGFTPNSSVTIEVFVSPGGNRILGPLTRPTGPGGSIFQFHHAVVPGNVVVITDVTTSIAKSLEVPDVAITAVDLDNDTVAGTAPPGSQVHILLLRAQGATVEAGTDGSWTADFAALNVDVTEHDTVTASVTDADDDSTVTHPDPGCPPTHTGQTCRIDIGSFSDNEIIVSGFTPNALVRIEVYDSVGGSLIYGPLTKQTDRTGFQHSRSETAVEFTPGNHIVVTDLSSSVVKELEIVPLAIESQDAVADTVSGTARPGEIVWAGLQGGYRGASAITGPDGRWTVQFSGGPGPDQDVTEQGRPKAAIFDSDFDATVAQIDDGPNLFPEIGVQLEHDSINAFGFTPNSNITFEVFESPGGSRIHGPITKRTGDNGGTGINFGLNPGPDLVPGNYVVVTDVATGINRTLELADISVDQVDPITDVVQGRAPAGSEVVVDVAGAARGLEAISDPSGNWRADFATIDYNITFTDWFRAGTMGADGGSTNDQLGAPIRGCVDDADTTCGSAAPDTIRESDGEVISGLGGDTLLITTDDPSASLRIVSGSGSDGIVLPAHAGRLEISVFGGAGADRMITRAFGGGGASSGSYFLDGGGGDDSMRGGDGDDTLHGGAGANDFSGGPGVDTCLSDTDRDRFQGCERIRRNHRRNHQQA